MGKTARYIIGGYHLAFIVLTPMYFLFHSFNLPLFLLSILLYGLCGVAITAGYHRLYSHKAYKLNPVIEFFVLGFATLAMQGSAIKWAHDHRVHHTHLDTEKDPYSVTHGFWHAHMGWLFKPSIPFNAKSVADLFKNPLVRFQHQYYGWLVLATHLVLVRYVFLLSNDLFSTLYLVVLFRLLLLHHCTWFINSLAHVWGAKTYSRELTAVDNGILAFLTFGEGYHNFHHTFMSDYRNGIRWYHFDPSKWFVWTCSKIGLASKLKRIDANVIKKSLIKHDMDLFERFEVIQKSDLYVNLQQLQKSFEKTLAELQDDFRAYQKLRAQKATRLEKKELRRFIRSKRRELRAYWKSWLLHVKSLEKNFVLPHV